MKKSLLFLTIFIGVFLITFSVSMYLTPINNIETSLGDEYEVLGAKSGFVDGEAYTTGIRFYNGSYYNELKASTTLAASNTWYLPTADGTDGQVMKTDGNGNLTWVTVTAGGSVTYVGIAVPTGLTVTGTPITTSGTTTIALTSGYEIPKTASTSNWQTAYDWGNHATAGYMTQAYASSTYQLLGDYMTLAYASSTYQPKGTYVTQAYASTTYGLIASNNTWTGQNTFGNASTTNLTVSTNSQLGTIVSGTWNGTTIGVGYGGTGLTGISAGGLLYGSALNTIGVLASSTNGYYLAINSSGYPAWQELSVAAGNYAAASIDGDDINSNLAGRSLTLTSASPDTLDADAELYSFFPEFVVASSTMSTSTAVVSYKVGTAITLTEVSGWCHGGTTTIMMDERAATTPKTAGTDILSSGLAIGDYAVTTSFANAGIASGAYINLDIDGYFTSSPTKCFISIKGTLDD